MNKKTNTPIDLRPHPLDAAHIGPEGLVALLVDKFEAAMNDPALARSYAAMTDTRLGVRDREVVRT